LKTIFPIITDTLSLTAEGEAVMKIRVAVLFGGRSVEHEVSVISAVQAMDSMNPDKYDIVPVYMTKSGGEFYTSPEMRTTSAFKDIPGLLKKAVHVNFLKEDGRVYLVEAAPRAFGKKLKLAVDVAFPIVHGTNVEDGTLAGYLRLLGLPLVGCDVLSSALGMDKYASKIILREAGIPVLDCLYFFRRDYLDPDGVIEKTEKEIGYPVIVKPVNLGSSVGISKATDREKLASALELAFTFSDRVIIERAITSLREINCAVIGDGNTAEASECEEPLNAGDILSYEDKYIDGSKGGGKSSGMASLKRQIPAAIPSEVRDEIRATACRAFTALGCSGVSRIDFMIDGENGKLYLNEINTIPGSLAFYLFEPLGIKYRELLDRMISIALKRARDEEEITYSFDSNILSLGGGKFTGKK